MVMPRPVLRTRNTNRIDDFFSARKRKSPTAAASRGRVRKLARVDENNNTDIHDKMKFLNIDTLGRTRAYTKQLERGKLASEVDALLQTEPSPKGTLALLPPEILVHIMDTADERSVSKLSFCSHDCMDMAACYLRGPVARRRFANELVSHTGPFNFCCNACAQIREERLSFWVDWGKLWKCVTCLMPTHLRVNILKAFFDAQFDKIDLSMVHCAAGWGRLFMTMIEKWEFSECERVYNSFMSYKNSALKLALHKFLDEPHGSDSVGEQRLRVILRGLFLDRHFKDPRDLPFWIGTLLKTLSTPHKAKLLYMLYAPLDHTGSIDYLALCRTSPTTLERATRSIQPLGNALTALNKAAGDKSVNMFALIEEITTFPEAWSLNNFASLLLLSPQIGAIALNGRCVGGHQDEAVQIFVAIKNLLGLWNAQAGPLTSLLQQAFSHCFPSATERMRLIRLITNRSLDNAASAALAINHNWRQEIGEELRGMQILYQALLTLSVHF